MRADLGSARKARDRRKTTLLTTFLAAVRNREIELGKEAGDEDIEALLATAIKRNQEAAGQMRAGKRADRAADEESEAEFLRAYLPPRLGEGEVRELVREAVAGGASDLGSVMREVMPKVKGRFDGKQVNRLAREELG